jgi:hypothetical protein
VIIYLNSIEILERIEAVKNTVVAISVASETILDIITTTKKTKSDIKRVFGVIAINTPVDVATPFPPLKFKKGVNICPQIVKIPPIITV